MLSTCKAFCCDGIWQPLLAGNKRSQNLSRSLLHVLLLLLAAPPSPQAWPEIQSHPVAFHPRYVCQSLCGAGVLHRPIFIQCWYWSELRSPYPMRLPNPNPVPDKNRAPKGQKLYPTLRLGSRGRFLRHFQTLGLYWINFSLRGVSHRSPSGTVPSHL